jgi:hypothetical protein
MGKKQYLYRLSAFLLLLAIFAGSMPLSPFFQASKATQSYFEPGSMNGSACGEEEGPTELICRHGFPHTPLVPVSFCNLEKYCSGYYPINSIAPGPPTPPPDCIV